MSERTTRPADMLAGLTAAWQDAAAGGGLFSLGSQAFDPRRWLGSSWEAALQPLDTIQGLPRFAGFPTLDRKVAAVLGGWLLLMQRAGEQSAMLSRAWMEAYLEFAAEMNRAAAEGRPAQAGRELIERWAQAFNVKLQKTQRSDEFLAAQRRLLDAFLSTREGERDLVETVANAFDLPTRTELDDVHRSVHDLKREVRRLRRELNALKAGASSTSPSAEPPRAEPGRQRRSVTG